MSTTPVGTVPTTVHRVPTALGTIAVHEFAAESPAAPTALLWHSMFVDGRSWARLVPFLSSRRRLLVVDGPGYGQSSPLTRRSTIGECAGVAEQLLAHLGVETVDWVGNAWGGHTGMHLAATVPGRVRSLVTISSPVAPVTDAERRQIALLTRVLRITGPIRPLRDKIAAVQLAQPDGVHRPVVDAALRRPSRRSLALTVESFVVGRTDLSWALPRIAAPTLVVATDSREDYSPQAARAVVAALPRGRSAVVEGSGVLAPLEQPRATADLVLGFWDDVEAST
jgi:pimeloyl-ACP methyl ester carboxylesterase